MHLIKIKPRSNIIIIVLVRYEVFFVSSVLLPKMRGIKCLWSWGEITARISVPNSLQLHQVYQNIQAEGRKRDYSHFPLSQLFNYLMIDVQMWNKMFLIWSWSNSRSIEVIFHTEGNLVHESYRPSHFSIHTGMKTRIEWRSFPGSNFFTNRFHVNISN